LGIGTGSGSSLAFAGIFVNSSGVLENESTGSLYIDNAGAQGIFSQGTLNNSGLIDIGATGNISQVGMYILGSFTNHASGNIRVDKTGNGGILLLTNTTNSGTIQIGSENNVSGVGFDVAGNLTNNGSIEVSRTSSYGIQVRGVIFSNEGMVKIGNAGTVATYGLWTDGGTFNNNNNLQIGNVSGNAIHNNGTLANTGQIQIGTTTISGSGIYQNGSFSNDFGATISINNTNGDGITANQPFTNQGFLYIGNTGPVNASGINCLNADISNQGLIELNGMTNPVAYAGLFVESGRTFTNQGTIRAGNASPLAYRCLRVNGTFQNDPGAFLYLDNAPFGIINSGSFSNQGTISVGSLNGSQISTYGIYNIGGTFDNQNAVSINRTTGNAFQNAGSFTNSGTLNIGNQAATGGKGIDCTTGNLTNSGTINIQNTGSYALDIGGNIDVTNSGSFNLSSNCILYVQATGEFINTGIVNLDQTSVLQILSSGIFQHNGGSISIGGNASVIVNGTLQLAGGLLSNSGIIKGTGTVTGQFGAGGNIAPGNSVGILNVSGDYDQSNGNLQIEVSSGGFDRLAVSGTATASGTLTVTWLDFTPTAGQEFSFITCATCTGAFTNLNVQPVSGLVFSVEIESGTFVLKAASALPVEMTGFTAWKEREAVALFWQTATETNNEGYYVERKTSAKNDWERLGFVKGQGTSQQTHDYHFTDKTPDNGVNYYRLRQTDFDGSEHLSAVVSVAFSSNNEEFLVFPNPVSVGGRFNLSLPDKAEEYIFRLFDNQGRQVMLQSLFETTTSMEAPALPAGIYRGQLTNGSELHWVNLFVR
jgi:hypothetical protein